MVKPRDHDVVFMEDGGNDVNETSASSTVTSTGDCVAVDVGPATPLSQSQQPSISVSSPLPSPLPSQSTMSLSETTGNRIYKQLLREYYDRYFHPVHGTPTEQNRIRKILLDRFHERIGAVSVLSNIDHDIDGDIDIDIDVEANCSAQRRLAMSPLGSAPVASPANQGREGISTSTSTSTSTILPSTATPTSTSTSAVAVANSPSKPQFLVHRKQGTSFCFNQVFFQRNIDQKIKESFERMRRDHGESGLGTPPPATRITKTAITTTALAATNSASAKASLGNKIDTHINHNHNHNRNHTGNTTFQRITTSILGSIPRGSNTNDGKPSENHQQKQHAVANDDASLRTTFEAILSSGDKQPSMEEPQGSNNNDCDERGQEKICSELTRKDIAVSRTEGSLPSNEGPSLKKVLPQPRNQEEMNRQEVEAAAAAAAAAIKPSIIQQEHHPDEKLPIEATEGSWQAVKGAANANENSAVSETTENQAEETGANSREFAGAEHQASGCGTGEKVHKHHHNNNNNNTRSPKGKNDSNVMGGSSQIEIQTNIPGAQRKRKRIFIWKSNDETPTRTKGPAADQKKESLAADVTPKVNTSNWGKLQALFRWSSPAPLLQKVASKPNPSGPTNAAESERKIIISSRNTTSSSSSPIKRGDLEPMPHILVSPYEGNRSAEVGEEPFEEWKDMMKPIKRHERNGDDDVDGDDSNSMNPLLSKLYGDPLALTIFKARSVIAGLDPLYETSWKGGKIGELNLGWIPKRQLLLCLSEDKIGAQSTTTTPTPMLTIPDKGERQDDGDERYRENDNDEDTEDDENSHSDDGYDETESLQNVVRKLECFKLVLAAMKEWKLKYDYPELYSTKEGTEFAFRKNDENESENEESNLEYNKNQEETKRNCYKCQIFVARVFATLLLFDKEQKVGPSLLGKVRACLEILNKHVRAHPSELANLLKKKTKMERKAAGELSNNITTLSKRPREEDFSSPDQKSQHIQTHHRKANKRSRRKIEGTYEEREATLGASFAMVKKESETLLEMMDYYKSRLLLVKVENGRGERCGPHHLCLEAWNEEIDANLEREFAKEERLRKKIALARLRRSGR